MTEISRANDSNGHDLQATGIPRPVCIAGMHRSGASTVTRLLGICGLSLGPVEDLLPASDDNPDDQWGENRSLTRVNDAILRSFGGGWDLVPDFPSTWTTAPELLGTRAEASRLLDMFDGQPSWGWSDARTSLTSPFWRDLLPNLTMVVCLRNPVEVATSFARSGGASPQFSYDLWLRYNRSVLAHTSPRTRVVTHVDSWFADPDAELRRICSRLGIEVTDAARTEALATIQQGPLQCSATLGDLVNADDMRAEVITTYQLLCNEAGSVYQQVAARELIALDQTLPEADDEGTSWAQRWRGQQFETMSRELLRRVVQAEGSLGELVGQLTSKEHELARLRQQVSQLNSSATSVSSGRVKHHNDAAGAA